MKAPPNFAGSSMKNVHSVMRGPNHEVVVRHPSLPGVHMQAAGQDYAELPPGSRSPKSPAGGISGGLGPFQSEQGAEMGEYTNG